LNIGGGDAAWSRGGTPPRAEEGLLLRAKIQRKSQKFRDRQMERGEHEGWGEVWHGDSLCDTFIIEHMRYSFKRKN
jgi:hypothetical protein